MGHVFDFHEAGQYDAGFDKEFSRYCLDLEITLMMDLLKPVSGQRILDIGCGTGMSMMPLLDQGLDLTGIDPSAYMLDRALARLGNRVALHQGPAEDLPFDDNAFETAFFFTSLEFTDRPAKAIEEACRVSRERVVIGVLNRHAPVNLCRRFKSFLTPSMFAHAHFFSIWELRRTLFAILGHVPVHWRTTGQFPFFRGRAARYVENVRWVQKSIWGTFIGMRIKPVPKFRTRPMALTIKEHKLRKPVTGLCSESRTRENGMEKKGGQRDGSLPV